MKEIRFVEELSVEPAIEPVTTDEAMNWLRVSETSEAAIVARLVKAARLQAETKTGCQCVTATWIQKMDAFPDDADFVRLRRGPLQSVTSVKYLDSSGVQQTLVADTDYLVDTDARPGRIYLPDGATWPTTDDVPRAVEITYVAGWPLSGGAATTPEDVKFWILRRAATLYEHREEFEPGQFSRQEKQFIDGLLDGARFKGF